MSCHVAADLRTGYPVIYTLALSVSTQIKRLWRKSYAYRNNLRLKVVGLDEGRCGDTRCCKCALPERESDTV